MKCNDAPDIGHYVRMAHKLANRLGIARFRARRFQREAEYLRDVNADLRHQVEVLREANRNLNDILYRRDTDPKPAPAEVTDDPWPAGTIGW